jgi:hypothetical protein
LLYIQQVKNGHIICFTYSRCKTNTLFALYTAGDNWSHYLLLVKNHIICFTNGRGKLVTLFALQTAGEKWSWQTAGEKLLHYLLYKQQV